MTGDHPEREALIRALTRLKDSPTPSALATAGSDGPQDSGETMIAFLFGEHALMIDSTTRCDLTTDSAASPVPLSPPLFAGIANLHGQLVSAYRAPGARADTYLFVPGEGADRVGLFIEQKPVMVRVKASEFLTQTPTDPQLAPACSGQAARVHNRLHYLTDAARLGPWLREWSQQLALAAINTAEASTPQ